MPKNRIKFKEGFTLIELLVVVAIISLLSSIIFASLNSARSQARDSKRISDFRQVQTALTLYFDKYGRYPNETPVMPDEAASFNSMVQQLVTEGFLSSVPVSPPGGVRVYSYYNYFSSPDIGGLLVVGLENLAPTTVPKPPSCRPFGAGNWCSTVLPSSDYCLCNPY